MKDVELMDGTTHLNVNVAGRKGLEVFVGWDCLRHDRVGAKSLSGPGCQANHPLEPKKFGLAVRLRSYIPRWRADRNVIGIEYGLARGRSRRGGKEEDP